MKNERLLALLDCLVCEGKKTAADLARRFEVTERTIYRDIESLCSAGVPIGSESGIGGGFSLVEEYRIDRSFLSRDELSDLTSLIKGFNEAVKDRHLERSLGKLSALGKPASSSESAESPDIPPPLIVNFSPWGGPSVDASMVIALRKAIAERRVVRFGYVDTSGSSTERTVEPFSLVISGTAWYLHAFCRLRRSFRLFKVKRIRNLEAESEVFDPRLRLPVPQPFSFQDSTEPLVDIVVSADRMLRQALEEAFGEEAVNAVHGGSIRCGFRYPLGPYLVQYLLSFGPGIEVIEPLVLRRMLLTAASAIAGVNADTTEN